MIDWEVIRKDLGFKSEKQMWTLLIVSLRTSEAIAAYLKVSRGAVHRRRTLMHLNKPSRRGQTYRKAEKRALLDSLPETVWVMPLQDIVNYISVECEEEISPSYISKYKRLRGL